MKFACGRTRYERRLVKERTLAEWHYKFCWWPTEIGQHDCRWLETVHRRKREFVFSHYTSYRWEYKEIKQADDVS